MSDLKAIEILESVLKCEQIQVQGKCYSGCKECEECDLCYAQGTTVEYIEALEIAIDAMKY